MTFDTAPVALPSLTLTAGGNLNVTAGGSITETGAVTVPGITTLATTVAGSDILLNTQANNFGGALAFASTVTVTTTTGSIAMAAAATTSSGTGAITYTAGMDVALGSLSTGGGVNVIANGGSVFSAAGSGTNVTAGSASTLQAFNGVVGTQAAPVTVNVNPGTLSIRSTTAVTGISAFITGIVLPSNALTLLNAPPGLVCFNICSVASSPVPGVSGLARSTFGYLNPDTIIPAFYPQLSRSVLISDITSVYMPDTLLQPSSVPLSSGISAVQSMEPNAQVGASCNQEAAAPFDVRCAVQ